MKNEVKKFQKKAMTIGVTGVGLATLGSVSLDANTSMALGKLGKGLGTIGSLTAMETSMNILGKYTKKKRW